MRTTVSTGWLITASLDNPATAIGGPTAARIPARRAATVLKPAIDHGPSSAQPLNLPVAVWPLSSLLRGAREVSSTVPSGSGDRYVSCGGQCAIR
jgi:hypothetical protein